MSIILSDSRFRSCVMWLSFCLHLEASGWASYPRAPPSVSRSGSHGLLGAGGCFSSTVHWLHSERHTHNKNTNITLNLVTQRLTFLPSWPWMDCTSSSTVCCCCASMSSTASPSLFVSPCSGTPISAGTSSPTARDLGANG